MQCIKVKEPDLADTEHWWIEAGLRQRERSRGGDKWLYLF